VSFRRLVSIAVLVSLLSLPALAQPSSDGPYEPIGSRITKIIKIIKHFFVVTPADEISPPKP
jgi:hypothetical protein